MDTAFTLISFFIVTSLVGLGTFLIVRRQKHDTSTGYFLAGRSLGAIYIAFSLLLTNLSTEQLVGLNGAAFTDGLSVMAWEVVSVLSLVMMALFFLPKFLRSGISTVPQFLELRFDHTTQVICNLIFLIAYTVILLPIVLYTGALGLNTIVDVKGLFGFSSDTAALWFSVWLVGIIGSIYAIFGGMRGIAVSDTFNGVLLLVGGFLIVWFGLDAAGKGAGVVAGINNITTAHPEKFNSLGGPHQSVPFFSLFTGVILLTTFYWCTNQQIIQRTFAAHNRAAGEKGVLLTGALKLLGPLYLVLPGIIAFYLFAGSHPELKPDQAYGLLVKSVLPPWLTGFFLAAMAGAVLSSFCGALNSTSTLFSLGIYRGLLRKDASELDVVKAGKTFSTVVAIISMVVAPLLVGQDSIFGYLQKMNGLYFIPIFSVVLMGLLLRRMPASAAKVGLSLGVIIIAAGYFIPALDQRVTNFGGFHFLGVVFLLLCSIMGLMTVLAPRAEAWVHEHSGDVEMTSWRWTKPVAALLVVTVLGIYAWFADFSVVFEKPAAAPATAVAPVPEAPTK
jgi:solute:Na+ symporter, SSS family